MKPSDLDIAIAEAERFIERAKVAKRAFSWHGFKNDTTVGYFVVDDTRATAAVKRASMDLTRALVAIRRSS